MNAKENDFANEINKALKESNTSIGGSKQQGSGPVQASASVFEPDFSQSKQQAGTKVEGSTETESIWNAETAEKVVEFAKTQADIKEQRTALNDQLKAAKSTLIAMGFNGEAMEAAIKYSNTEEGKRENFDITYAYFRKCLGHPIQDDLFVAAMREQVNVSVKNKSTSNTLASED